MNLENIQAVLLDIEGTVCPVQFVHETLFPYALRALPDVTAQRWDDQEFASYKQQFPADAQQSPAAFLAHVQDLTARDVKIAYLKNLQGYLWKTGYASAAFSTPLFPDVAPVLKTWHAAGKQLAIFSSGSVDAQKLLFAYVETGQGSGDDSAADTEDLNPLLTSYSDTVNAGPKLVASSYVKIARELGRAPGHILFLSDNVKEVDAALEAGMHAIVVDRPGNAPLSNADRARLSVIESLSTVRLS